MPHRLYWLHTANHIELKKIAPEGAIFWIIKASASHDFHRNIGQPINMPQHHVAAHDGADVLGCA
jgi:hypothetical protein